MRRTLRVASWNIHEGVPADGHTTPDGRLNVSEVLLRARVEVAALQEVPFCNDQTLDSLKIIGEETGLPYLATFPMSPSAFSEQDEIGVALLSGHPLADVDQTFLPNPKLCRDVGSSILTSHDKGFISAQLEGLGLGISVLSLHVFPFHIFDRDPGEAEFEHIWMALAASIDRLADRPLIVCGDFNTGGRNLLTSRLRRASLTTTTHDRPTCFGSSSDDILYSDHLTLLNADIVPTLSDHALCVAEFGVDVW